MSDDVNAVAGDLVAVHFDLQVSQPTHFFDVDIGRAAHLAEHARDGVGFFFQDIQVVAKDFDSDGGFNPTYQFINAQARSAARKLDATPGKLRKERSRIFSTSSSFDFVVCPFIARFQRHHHVAEIDPHRIRGDVRPAGL